MSFWGRSGSRLQRKRPKSGQTTATEENAKFRFRCDRVPVPTWGLHKLDREHDSARLGKLPCRFGAVVAQDCKGKGRKVGKRPLLRKTQNFDFDATVCQSRLGACTSWTANMILHVLASCHVVLGP